MQAQMAEIQARVQVEAAKLQLEENKSQTDAAIRVAEMENDVQLCGSAGQISAGHGCSVLRSMETQKDNTAAGTA